MSTDHAHGRLPRQAAGGWRQGLAVALHLFLAVGCQPAPAQVLPALSGVAVHPVQHRAAPQLPAKALREVSGLAWDSRRAELVGVTDRGWLLRWTLHLSPAATSPGDGAALELVSAVRLAGPSAVNAESVDMLPPAPGQDAGQVWVMDEPRHRVAVYAPDGREVVEQPLPAALQAQRQRLQGKGVEAIGWHPRHGLLAVLQQPLEPQAGMVRHQVHGVGRHWVVQGRGGPRSAIKALHVLGDRLLLLERDAQASPAAHWLHELALDTCQPEADSCASQAVPLVLDRVRDDNVEGLACLAADRCLIVTDNGNRPGVDTRWWLLHLER